MCCRTILQKRLALGTATFLLLVPGVLAGGSMRSGSGYPSPSASAARSSARPAAAPVPRWASVSATVTMKAAPQPFYVTLRGPDGTLRRYPVEGGPASIRYTQVVVQPGQSLTIHVAPTR
jgi:hypothetical protein